MTPAARAGAASRSVGSGHLQPVTERGRCHCRATGSAQGRTAMARRRTRGAALAAPAQGPTGDEQGGGRSRRPGEDDDRGGYAVGTVRLTVAQAVVRFLANQYSERDGVERRLIPG